MLITMSYNTTNTYHIILPILKVCILLKNSFLKWGAGNKKWSAVCKILVRYIASICVYKKKPTSCTKIVQIILHIKHVLIAVT